MPSFSRFAAGAAFISGATASAVGSMPSQTIPGFGTPLFAQPTEAPKVELVKARFAKKAVTNVCSEWTIPGGYGQPQCSNSETCLFTSALGYLYEGCGQTSIPYEWITKCYDYPKAASSSPPISQTYCPSTAPYCGYYAFVFDDGEIAYNVGCSTEAYTFYADLLPSVTGDSTSTDVVVQGGGGSSFTATGASTDLSLSPSSATQTSTSSILIIPGASQSSSAPSSATTSSNPVIGSHSKSSTPIGAIVGGVVGGIAVIALIAFLVWFFLRKRRQDKAAAQAHEAQVQANQANAAASNFPHNRISEIGGTMKPPPPPANTYVPPPAVAGVYGEKPTTTTNTQEVYRPPQGPNSAYTENTQQPHSPPPVYANATSPPVHYNELEHQNPAGISRPMSTQPVSPATTGGPSQGVSPITTPTPQQQYQHMSMMSNATELSGHNSQPSYSPRPGFQEMASSNGNMAIPMRPAGAAPVQELGGNMQQAVPMRAAGAPHGMQEMSAASGGVNRPPPHGQPQRFDMNGNPMG